VALLAFSVVSLAAGLTGPVDAGAFLTPDATAQVPPAGSPSCRSGVPLPWSSRPGDLVNRDNFESGSLSRWATTDEGDAWAGVTDDYAVTGDCSGRLIVTGSSTSRANIRTGLPAGTNDAWAIGWFRILREGYDGSNVPTFRFFNGPRRIADVYRENGGGGLWLRTARGDGSWSYARLRRWVSLNAWHKIVVHVHADWSASRVDVLLDGVLVISDASIYLPAERLTTAMVGAEHVRQKMDLVFDNIIVKAS
jgi:hypothetical protein